LGLIRRVLGTNETAPKKRAAASASRLGALDAGGSRASDARESLRTALRETLEHNGIPVEWMASEVFASSARDGTQGFHWRLLVKHWDQRLAIHCVALEDALVGHLFATTPEARDWLTGVSWQFTLKDRSVANRMPPPGTWTSKRRTKVEAGVDAAREQLNSLLSQREPDMPQGLESLPPSWAPTRPGPLDDEKKRR
jgi:hypothetical protein